MTRTAMTRTPTLSATAHDSQTGAATPRQLTTRRRTPGADADSRTADAALVAALVAKDPLALERFSKRYRALMYATASKTLRDEGDLEEVVQDVLWTVWRKAHTFRGDSGLSTWVYRVTQNAARMLLRKKRRVPMPMEQDVMDAQLERSRQGEVSHLPEAVLRGQHVAQHIDAAIAKLPADNRDLFLAMDVRGEDRDAVAERHGLSISALKARLHRVRKAVREAAANELAPVRSARGQVLVAA